jgi:hypothetical protein
MEPFSIDCTRLAFASHYVEARLFERFLERESEQMERFLGARVVDGRLGSLRGYLFEGFAHGRLSSGGDFRVRPLAGGNESRLIVAKHGVCNFATLDKVDLCALSTYWEPLAKNFPAIDALSISAPSHGRRTASLFQMTVANKHDIDRSGIDAVLSCVRLLIGDSNAVVRLYFVVTRGSFNAFPLQLFEQGGNAIERPDGLEQWALEMPFQ